MFLAPLARSSVGRKALVALTGLGLLGFVIAHMLGNLQVFAGPEALNAYAAQLKGLGPLLWVMRGGLLAVFAVHVVLALKLAGESKAARPQPYARDVGNVQAGKATKTMVLTGCTIAAFVLYHLAHFTWGVVHPGHHGVPLDEQGRHDVYAMVVTGFQEPLVSGLYLVAMALLAVHLFHGVSSTLQTLGLNSPRHRPLIDRIGRGLALVIFLGNASMPLAILLGLIGLPEGA